MDKLSYSLGIVIANNLKGLGVTELAEQDFTAAVNAVLKGEKTAITEFEAQQEVSRFIQGQEEERGKFQREAGERFLADNAKKEGVTVTPSGLQYQILNEGTGKQPKATDKVRCHYEGTLIDGTVFDSSYRRGTPAEFGLNQVIAGWTEGVQLMKEGAKYKFYLPYRLAYGEHGAGATIPPYAALVFTVELIKVL